MAVHEPAMTPSEDVFNHSQPSREFESRRESRRLPVSRETDATLLELLYDTVGNPSGWPTFLRALTEGGDVRHGGAAVCAFHAGHSRGRTVLGERRHGCQHQGAGE